MSWKNWWSSINKSPSPGWAIYYVFDLGQVTVSLVLFTLFSCWLQMRKPCSLLTSSWRELSPVAVALLSGASESVNLVPSAHVLLLPSSEHEHAELLWGQAYKAAMCVLWLNDFLQCGAPSFSQRWKGRRGCGRKNLFLYHQPFPWALGFYNIKANTLETQKSFSTFLWQHDPFRQGSVTDWKDRRAGGNKHMKRKHVTFYVAV